jgi:hypothetical protein
LTSELTAVKSELAGAQTAVTSMFESYAMVLREVHIGKDLDDDTLQMIARDATTVEQLRAI